MERSRIEWEEKEEQRKKALPDGDKEDTKSVRNWADELATIKAGYKDERRTERETRQPWVAALLQRALSTGMEVYKIFDDVRSAIPV